MHTHNNILAGAKSYAKITTVKVLKVLKAMNVKHTSDKDTRVRVFVCVSVFV